MSPHHGDGPLLAETQNPSATTGCRQPAKADRRMAGMRPISGATLETGEASTQPRN